MITRRFWRLSLAAVAASLVGAACAAPPAAVRLPEAPYTTEDADFLRGMIMHHRQAVTMAAWAPTNGASEDVKILASRIAVSQKDEIAFMKTWLTDHHEPVEMAMGDHRMTEHDMSGSTMLMPGMLTAQQLQQLSSARGTDFDKAFLRFMIQHHRGALTMVDHLFATRGSGQEEAMFRFATDVSSDQTTEINRMASMLSNINKDK
ncbi:MAG: DUF305 domain-containing protein [Gemmatimonadaceae bacterium]